MTQVQTSVMTNHTGHQLLLPSPWTASGSTHSSRLHHDTHTSPENHQEREKDRQEREQRQTAIASLSET